MRRVLTIILVIVLLAGLLGGGFFGYKRFTLPIPAATFTSEGSVVLPAEQAAKANLPWPTTGQAAVGTYEAGVLETSGEQKPTPIASVTKVMTALSVLKQKPLKAGEQGPAITVTAEDMAIYTNYVAQGGSVLPVELGEQLSEYQALQALMIPSANNIADMVAIWAFGSMAAYHTFATQYAKDLGMTSTTYGGDASGLSPKTTSTAHDMVLLGQAALKEPVLAEIVNQKQAVLPVAGTVTNYNALLGRDNINGIKTGNSDEAGGAYLASSKQKLPDGSDATVIIAVAGAANLNGAMNAALPLVTTVPSGFTKRIVIHAGEIVGSYKTAWGSSVSATAKDDVALYMWYNSQPQISVDLKSLKASQAAGATAGEISVRFGGGGQTVPAVLAQKLDKPNFFWRLKR